MKQASQVTAPSFGYRPWPCVNMELFTFAFGWPSSILWETLMHSSVVGLVITMECVPILKPPLLCHLNDTYGDHKDTQQAWAITKLVTGVHLTIGITSVLDLRKREKKVREAETGRQRSRRNMDAHKNPKHWCLQSRKTQEIHHQGSSSRRAEPNAVVCGPRHLDLPVI